MSWRGVGQPAESATTIAHRRQPLGLSRKDGDDGQGWGTEPSVAPTPWGPRVAFTKSAEEPPLGGEVCSYKARIWEASRKTYDSGLIADSR
jgi:hypothetical protein